MISIADLGDRSGVRKIALGFAALRLLGCFSAE